MLNRFVYSFRNTKYWYVGEVVCFFEHELNGVFRFLAFVSTLRNAQMDDYGMISVNYEEDQNEQYLVCDTNDILTITGLVRYNDDINSYKVIWPNAKYYQRLENRASGQTIL